MSRRWWPPPLRAVGMQWEALVLIHSSTGECPLFPSVVLPGPGPEQQTGFGVWLTALLRSWLYPKPFPKSPWNSSASTLALEQMLAEGQPSRASICLQVFKKRIKIATSLETGPEARPLQQHCVFAHQLCCDELVTPTEGGTLSPVLKPKWWPQMVFPRPQSFSNAWLFLCCALGQMTNVLMFVCMEMGCLRLPEAKGSSQLVGDSHRQSRESRQVGIRSRAEEWPDAFPGESGEISCSWSSCHHCTEIIIQSWLCCHTPSFSLLVLTYLIFTTQWGVCYYYFTVEVTECLTQWIPEQPWLFSIPITKLIAFYSYWK